MSSRTSMSTPPTSSSASFSVKLLRKTSASRGFRKATSTQKVSDDPVSLALLRRNILTSHNRCAIVTIDQVAFRRRQTLLLREGLPDIFPRCPSIADRLSAQGVPRYADLGLSRLREAERQLNLDFAIIRRGERRKVVLPNCKLQLRNH